MTENLLGTGSLDPRHEQRLLALGVVFAARFVAPDGESFIVSCKHPNIYDRFAEQVAKMYHEDHGLPAQYRLPVTHPAPPMPVA